MCACITRTACYVRVRIYTCVRVHACAHHRYPGSDVFEHHVFEATPGGIWKEQMGWSSAAAQADKRIRFHNVAVWNRDTTLRFGVRKSASHVVEGTGGARGVFGNDTKVKATHEILALDFAKWLLESVKPDDFVLVKMDIVRAVLPSASRAHHGAHMHACASRRGPTPRTHLADAIAVCGRVLYACLLISSY